MTEAGEEIMEKIDQMMAMIVKMVGKMEIQEKEIHNQVLNI